LQLQGARKKKVSSQRGTEEGGRNSMKKWEREFMYSTGKKGKTTQPAQFKPEMGMQGAEDQRKQKESAGGDAAIKDRGEDLIKIG